MKISRRHVLAAMAGVPIVGALSAGAVAWQWWDRPAGEGLRALAPDEHDFVQAISEAWMPHGGDPALSGSEAELGQFLDDVLAAMAPGQARELKLLLQVLDDLTRVTHFSAYRHLSLDVRIDVLRGWLHSDQWLLRNGVLALLALVGTGYTTHPDVLPHLRPHFRCAYGR